MTQRRLIEQAFPLQKVSEDSRHEKNVRHGHISTLHIWPARRPLAACRAAIIAALMPDPGDERGRADLCSKIESITHWGTENGPALDYFRREIRKAFGGRAPRVLDPFAGGGAIPLEAMRLGCDVVANDYNPVAWFILKCTLEFPQRLAGKTWPLPREESQPAEPPGDPLQPRLLGEASGQPGDLAAHVRYWGQWVLAHARQELAPYYPTVDGQPTVAYLWARTVPCPDPKCGAEVPLLKTLWLCKKAEKTLLDTPENRARPDLLRIKRYRGGRTKVAINGRRALRMVPDPDRHRVDLEIWTPGPNDEVPPGTMSGAKARCPCCGILLTSDHIKQCGYQGKMGARLTAVVVDTGDGREYRVPVPEDCVAIESAITFALRQVADQIPFGLPEEPMPDKDRHRAVGSQLPDYGFNNWTDIYTSRQLLALLTFVKWIRASRERMRFLGCQEDWIEALLGYLALSLDRLVDQSTTLCLPDPSPTQSGVIHTFTRFAFPMTWDFIEGVTIQDTSGSFLRSFEWVAKVVEHLTQLVDNPPPQVIKWDATQLSLPAFDVIVTDPPYYDAIPYSDLSDLFYVWLRRIVGDLYPETLGTRLTPKDNELVQQSKSGDRGYEGKADYESGMSKAFVQTHKMLVPDGRMVIVFAHKDPEAWETLVSALINAGFTVTASWPIDTERQTRARAVGSAALASSIWLICRKRPEEASIGRFGAVRRAMQERITERLRYFWDIGISGPDFVWAAVGPALESYSAYDEVRRLDGSPFTVSEFLREVRRLVADFALGQILLPKLRSRSTEGLDEWTRYYLIHRNHFGLEAAPVGECILLSQGYGLDLNDLRGPRGFLVKAKGSDLRIARWDERIRSDLGNPHPNGMLPLIDVLHRLVWLWTSGDTSKLRTYANDHGLTQNDLFWAVAQAVLEMSTPKSKERTLLEALVAWGRGKAPDQISVQERLL